MNGIRSTIVGVRTSAIYRKVVLFMAELARFYGIVVWLIGGDHNPPHVHASYSGTEGYFDIKTGEQIKGDMKGKSIQLVAEWIELHHEELLSMWESQEFKKLDPLP